MSFDFSGNSGGEEMSEMQYAALSRQAMFYWQHNREVVIAILVILLLVAALFYLLGLTGRGALIDSILKIQKEKEKNNFSQGLEQGRKILPKFFILDFGAALVLAAMLFILFMPVVRLFYLEAYGFGYGMLLAGIIIAFSVFCLIFFLKKFGEIYIVSGNLNIKESLKTAYNLLAKNVGESFLSLFVFACLKTITFIIIFVAIFMLIIGGSGLLALVYALMGKIIFAILLVPSVLVLIAVIILAGSIWVVFSQAFWIMFFERTAAQKQVQEDEEVFVEEKKEEIVRA